MGCGVGFPGRILGTGVGLLEGADGASVGRDDVGKAVVGCTLGEEVVGLDEVGWDDAGAIDGDAVLMEGGTVTSAALGTSVGHAEYA